MDPVTALQRVAFLLEQSGAAGYKSQAFRRAADVIRGIDADELAAMADAGTLTRLDGIGASTAKVVTEALAGDTPEYLAELERSGSSTGTAGGGDRHEADTPAALADAEALTLDAVALRAGLQGDCHSHSLWSDGGASIRDMAEAARDLGHRYLVMTDHSPRLTIAHGLTAERLRQQLDEIAGLNDELLGALDVVVASAHSKLRMEPAEMTDRLVAAVESPHTTSSGTARGDSSWAKAGHRRRSTRPPAEATTYQSTRWRSASASPGLVLSDASAQTLADEVNPQLARVIDVRGPHRSRSDHRLIDRRCQVGPGAVPKRAGYPTVM